MIHFFSAVTVLTIHDNQIRLYGGGYGLRDAAALDAALHMPQVQFDGQFLHPTIFHMAAAYGFHLSRNHPFVDGNKRTAGIVMLAFLFLHGLRVTASEVDYYETMIAVATGRMDKDQLAAWLQTVTQGTPPEIE